MKIFLIFRYQPSKEVRKTNNRPICVLRTDLRYQTRIRAALEDSPLILFRKQKYGTKTALSLTGRTTKMEMSFDFESPVRGGYNITDLPCRPENQDASHLGHPLNTTEELVSYIPAQANGTSACALQDTAARYAEQSNATTISAPENTTSDSTPGNVSDIMEAGFKLFPRLPLETRLQIWNGAMPDARVAEIEWTQGQWIAPLESQGEVCALLRVCKESRKEYLFKYKFMCHYARTNYCPEVTGFAFQPKHYFQSKADLSRYPVCYFNETIEILYFGPSTANQFDNPLCPDAEKFLIPEALDALSSNEFLPQPCYADCDISSLIESSSGAESRFETSAGWEAFLKATREHFPRLEKLIIGFQLEEVDSMYHGWIPRFEGEVGLDKLLRSDEDNWDDYMEDYGIEQITIKEDGVISTAHEITMLLRTTHRGGVDVYELINQFKEGREDEHQ